MTDNIIDETQNSLNKKENTSLDITSMSPEQKATLVKQLLPDIKLAMDEDAQSDREMPRRPEYDTFGLKVYNFKLEGVDGEIEYIKLPVVKWDEQEYVGEGFSMNVPEGLNGVYNRRVYLARIDRPKNENGEYELTEILVPDNVEFVTAEVMGKYFTTLEVKKINSLRRRTIEEKSYQFDDNGNYVMVDRNGRMIRATKTKTDIYWDFLYTSENGQQSEMSIKSEYTTNLATANKKPTDAKEEVIDTKVIN